MSSLRCLFIVQGEGRGHLTQALALRSLLACAGHAVAGVIVGQNVHRTIPRFFEEKIGAPVHRVPSPSFVADATRRGVRPGATLWNGAQHLARLHERLSTIDALVKRYQPDVVVNFFEPLAGLYYGLRAPRPPMVSIAHQYLFLHPAYEFPTGWPISRRAARWFARLTAWGASRRLALSLYPVPDLPNRRLTVMPPLLRPVVSELETQTQPFLLAYLLNRGYVEDVIRWHTAHPHVTLHCFVDRPGAPETERYTDTLIIHQIDGPKFLSMMARCQGLVCTAGFESVAEAMYLGKPVQVMPVEGHFEQHCNAHDVERAGAGCWTPQLGLDPMLRMVEHDHTPDASFRQWVADSRIRFARAIESVAEAPRRRSAQPISPLRLASTD